MCTVAQRRVQDSHIGVQGTQRLCVWLTIATRSATTLADYVQPPLLRVLYRWRTRLGDRSFAVAGPQIWHSLPAALRAAGD